MTSFVYQPYRQEEQMNVLSSMNMERQANNVQSAHKSVRKSLILQQSSSQLKWKAKETNRDKGLTYCSKILDFDCYDDGELGGRKDRSLKIDCSGPADIVADINDLNYQYVPKKKEKKVNHNQNKQQQQVQLKVRSGNIEPQLASQPIIVVNQPVDISIREIVNDVQQKKKLQQSWDIEQKLKQKYNLFWFIIFLSILIFFLTQTTRQIGYVAYSNLKKIMI